MMTATQITDALRAAPMPLHVKEQILDQVLGYHDDLYVLRPMKNSAKDSVKTATRHSAARPKAERVADAREIGGFLFRETLPSGDDLFVYCKAGTPSYDVAVRDGQPVYCSCPDFRFHVSRDPDYCCKHCDLFRQQEEADAVIAECAREAAAWMTAWAWHKLGRMTDEECNAAYERLEAVRSQMHKMVQP